jgi:hypothetical protein
MPDISDTQYAVMRTDRINTWSHALWVGRHNSRTMMVGNAEPDGPPPEHVIGSGDLLADLRAAHQHFKPKKAKDAVLGLEFVFTASRAAFADLPADERLTKAKLLVETAHLYMIGRFGNEGQVVSLVLHLDEITPHVHAVALPIHWRVDARAGEREYYHDEDGKLRWRRAEVSGKPNKTWMLSADRDMGDRARMSQHQTRWAKMCEPLGLSRGREGSKDRHKTARQREAELAKATNRANAEAAALGGERESLVHDRAVVDMVADCQREEAAELKRLRDELETERAAWDASIAGREAALVADRQRADAERIELDERARKARDWSAAAKKREADLNAAAKRINAVQVKLDDREEALAEVLPVVTRAIAMVDPQTLPADARVRFYAVARELGVAVENAAKVSPRIAAVAASRRTWEGYQVGG